MIDQVGTRNELFETASVESRETVNPLHAALRAQMRQRVLDDPLDEVGKAALLIDLHEQVEVLRNGRIERLPEGEEYSRLVDVFRDSRGPRRDVQFWAVFWANVILGSAVLGFIAWVTVRVLAYIGA